ncbi:PIF / Ping-Pong family of plant transposase [Actinidia rufa]|uniref:PIF / Ping-Pong family of plant transposase n=1 Tax=Actinidia rufa TaxID=165716 RepID=A0A7J0EUH9_9ERIC|nr:PIF / Ping-Pong family of plant transposase [Actinidia rufa]
MVTRLLATKLYREFIKIPVSRRRLVETTQAFEELTSLPNMCGAIDATPIKIRHVPAEANPSAYRCREGFPAVLLQVVADHKKIFWDVCVKAPGGFDDSTHLRESVLYNRLISEDIVWDKVFECEGTGTPAQDQFDEALMKGRKMVEEAIGLLKGRWKILQDMNVGLDHAPQTIVACCVLHNLCQIAREPEPELWKEPEESGPAPKGA